MKVPEDAQIAYLFRNVEAGLLAVALSPDPRDLSPPHQDAGTGSAPFLLGAGGPASWR
jgi:hypothetical protein